MTATNTSRTRTSRIAGAIACLLAGLLGLSTPLHAQDAGKALNGLFQNFLKPGAPASAPSAQDLIGNLLGKKPTTGSADNDDLIKLLSQSITDIDEAKEIEIGRQIASVLLGAKPLDADVRLQRYVNQLGRWVSLQSPRPNLPWTFGVLDDAGYNAFAAPGGYIFVTRGLISRVNDETELAAILAHEVIHVVRKHHLEALQKSARSGLLSRALSSQLEKKLPNGLSARLLDLGRQVYTKGLSQQDELDADRHGVTLSARSGFDPYGLVAVLQTLRAQSAQDSAFALSFSTHPAPQVRLDQLELAMGEQLDVFAPAGKPMTIDQRLERMGSHKK
jgi:predicted Zn-dependent protease